MFFPSPQKKTFSKKRIINVKVPKPKKSKSSRDREKCAPKKEQFPLSLEAVGEGDERVISLQSRIALVDQFANAPQPLTWGVDGYYPRQGGRGIEWKRMQKCRVLFGYPQVIFFWKWSCHKRQVLVWKYVFILIVKPYQDIQNIIPKYEKRWDKQDVRVSL